VACSLATGRLLLLVTIGPVAVVRGRLKDTKNTKQKKLFEYFYNECPSKYKGKAVPLLNRVHARKWMGRFEV
jgi:hypothetical protein